MQNRMGSCTGGAENLDKPSNEQKKEKSTQKTQRVHNRPASCLLPPAFCLLPPASCPLFASNKSGTVCRRCPCQCHFIVVVGIAVVVVVAVVAVSSLPSSSSPPLSPPPPLSPGRLRSFIIAQGKNICQDNLHVLLRFSTPLEASLERSCASLEPPWDHLGQTWSHPRAILGHRGPSWAILHAKTV